MSFYKNRFYFKTKIYSIEQLKKIFSDDKLHYLELVVLFGSRADGTYHDKSDYDFALFCSEDLKNPWGNMAQVWNDIGDLLDLHECDYDIVDLSCVSNNIKKSIKKNYIVLKGDDSELQRLFNIND
ncbi:MAG: nucleotidyltransferase domain-containing protein [Campylobacterota bacterium]|nr:nucleotidyltransferase domain-containing protein [Campylobacterota bacterium]